LVIHAVAHVPDADRCVTPDLSEPGNVLMMLGTTDTEFAGSHLDLVCGEPENPGVAPAPDPDAPDRYRRLHEAMRAGLVVSCHDVSEGGLAVALAEMCIAGRLGISLDALPHENATTALFAESTGRLIVEVEPRSVPAFLRVMDDGAQRIGVVNHSGALKMPDAPAIPVSELADAFNSGAQR
jgi:phosphoribosylformylglycinamidine synthase